MLRVQEGWEGGIYTKTEAGAKLDRLRGVIAGAQQKIENINAMYARNQVNIESLQKEIQALGSHNLEDPTFEEKEDLIARLGIMITPSEDLETCKIECRLNWENEAKKEGESDLAK